MKTIALILLICLPAFTGHGGIRMNDPEATAIIKRSDQKLRGNSSRAEMKMTIVRPKWEREVSLKAWSLRDEFSLILITAPARDKGSAFLKRQKELWNWQPTIDRIIKMPPSMMMQSWMGSDFTNDDLIRESSVVKDYTHELDGKEVAGGRECYRIILTPKPEAPVVWGKVISWIDTEEYMQMKTEFYDEDGYLVNTMLGKEVERLGGKLLPSRMEMIPAEEEGHMTIIEYEALEFDVSIQEDFFSIQNMKRVR
jgi:outer membrane lipoprotein-sorting protein